jgi:hypothetical protein
MASRTGQRGRQQTGSRDVTTQHTTKPGVRRKPGARRGGTAVGIGVFAVVNAAIVAWIVFGRPALAENPSAARPTATATADATAATADPTPPATEVPAVPTTVPTTEVPAPPPPPAPVPPVAQEVPVADHPPVETAFLNEVADSGLAPPIPDEAQLQMARDVCQAFEEGATFQVLVETFVNMGATTTEADSFVRNAAVSFCPQHLPG